MPSPTWNDDDNDDDDAYLNACLEKKNTHTIHRYNSSIHEQKKQVIVIYIQKLDVKLLRTTPSGKLLSYSQCNKVHSINQYIKSVKKDGWN